MHHQAPTLHIIRKTILLAMLGFGVITLSGPILAVLSVAVSLAVVVLSFALVGLLVWFLLRTLYLGHLVAWQGVRELVVNFGGVVQYLGAKFGRLVAWPFRVSRRAVVVAVRAATFLMARFWSAAKVMGEISLVTMTGILVGMVVGAIIGVQNHDIAAAIPTNAVLGGVLATVAGIVMTVLERKASVRQPSQGLS